MSAVTAAAVLPALLEVLPAAAEAAPEVRLSSDTAGPAFDPGVTLVNGAPIVGWTSAGTFHL